MSIILRETKGSPLTHQELDKNFAYTIPVSTIISIASPNIPTGWLKCNGEAISRTEYLELFESIGTIYGSGDGSTTFNLPDLRGEFIRGWDDGKGTDTGREMGSKQLDEFKSHKHEYLRNPHSSGEGVHAYRGIGDPYLLNRPTGDTLNTGGSETRPRNIALNYIIKT